MTAKRPPCSAATILEYWVYNRYIGIPDYSAMGDTLFDSIQCMNFAKKLFNSMFESILLTQNSIQTIIQIIINSDDSIQKSIKFNSQGIIDTGQIRKVPEKGPKSVES